MRMIRLIVPIVRALLLTVGSMAVINGAAADPGSDRVRDGIARHTGGKVPVDRVTATPVPGIYEVVSGTGVFYSDATGRYAFIDGRLVDTEKRQDLTRPTLDALSRIDFSSLPLNQAIRKVIGSGKRQVAIFEDPACPSCRELHASLAQLTDVTIHIIPFPVISEASIPAAVAALCAPPASRAALWDAYMADTPSPQRIDLECQQASVDLGNILAFGEKHAIRNTPTLIFGNGTRVVGAMPLEQLAQALDEQK